MSAVEGTNVGSSLVLDHDTRDQERTETSFHGCKDLYDSSCRHSTEFYSDDTLPLLGAMASCQFFFLDFILQMCSLLWYEVSKYIQALIPQIDELVEKFNCTITNMISKSI